MGYVAVRGKGDPDAEDGEYRRFIPLLYSIVLSARGSEHGSRKAVRANANASCIVCVRSALFVLVSFQDVFVYRAPFLIEIPISVQKILRQLVELLLVQKAF